MSLKQIICIQILFILNSFLCNGEESVFKINEKNSINTVSEKFISFNVDPAFLLTDLNISSNSLKLAQHLYPAYIRIGGPTTKFVKYVDDDSLVTSYDNNTMTWTISRPMWASINGWLMSTNLTSIFCINDHGRVDGVRNSNRLNQLFNYTDQLNINTYWQLEFDCANNTIKDYIQDLLYLYNMVQSFPNKKDAWKIVGSDTDKCLSTEKVKDTINNYENITAALLLEPSDEFPGTTINKNKVKVPLWIMAPKYSAPITFSSTILWAKQIGDAATNGYEVIFRQPRIRELFSVSPIYWISLIHKRVMGRNVLEIKSTTNPNKDIFLYSHCAKNQSNSINSSAITIFFINNATISHDVSIKVAIIPNADIDIQSYILTSTSDETNDIFLNSEKLLFENLDDEELLIKPNLITVNQSSNLKLNLPAKSIGFFVIPSTKIPACSNSKNGIEETNEDEKLSFLEDIVLSPRFGEDKKIAPLNELYKMVEKELEADEAFYRKAIQKNQNAIQDWKKLLADRMRDIKSKKPLKNEIKIDKQQELLPQIVDKHKLLQINSKKPDVGKLILGRNKEMDKAKELKKSLLEDLTSEEVEKILHYRQKNKEYEKYKLTSSELEDIFSVLVKKFKKTTNKQKRAINMELLNMHTKDSSNEDLSLNNKYKELEKEMAPKSKAKLNLNTNKPFKGLFLKNIPVSLSRTTTEVPKPVNSKEPEHLQFKTALNNFESIEDRLDDHKFYDKLGFTVIQSKPSPKELFEAELDANNVDDDEYTLEDDIQAYLKTKNKEGLLKAGRNRQKFVDLMIPKAGKEAVDIDMFYDDLDSIFKYKRSPSTENFKHSAKRVRRQSILDKLNIPNLFEDNSLLQSLALNDDNLLKLKSYFEGDIIEDIKQKLEEHRDKIKEKNDEILQKIEDIKSQIRIPRSLDNINLQDIGAWYKYKPLNDANRNWKPEQLIRKGRMYEEKKLEARKKLNEELKQRKLLRIRRDAIDIRENEIESNENRIDFTSNSIIKENVLPKSNYMSNKVNDNQIVKGSKTKEATKDASRMKTTTGKDAKILSYDDEQLVNTTLYSSDDKNVTLTPKFGTTKEQIQKINVNFKPTFFERMLDIFTSFFNDIEQKITYYFFS